MFRRINKERKWEELVKKIKEVLGSPDDLIIRTVLVRERKKTVYCIYIKSLADKTVVNEYILEPVMRGAFEEVQATLGKGNEFVREIPFTSTSLDQLVHKTVDALISSHCVLADLERDRLLIIPVTNPQHRQVEEPEAEPSIRGPHEGFTESLETNISLIRKRLRNPNLRLETFQLGSQTRTTVMLVYLANVAPAEVVMEARKRIGAIRTDSVLESAYMEEFIQDNSYTFFPLIANTEKPDVLTARLIEGKIGVLVDGTPNVLLAPMTFFEFFGSPEDYYQRADIATFVRWIRFLSFLIAVFVPAVYVAVTTFHQELLPTPLLISLAAQAEGVPLPTLGEVLIMEIIFEIIREAGLRMPRAIGQALSIVGAIVLGQAAVEAGLISAAVVIVVSVTGIANFVVPTYSFGIAQRLLRFTFLFLAGFMGLYGLLCAFLFFLAHLHSLRSFGVPYLAPAVPFYWPDWKDIFIRVPRPLMDKSLPRFMQSLSRKRGEG
jgi:spore germination protein KA